MDDIIRKLHSRGRANPGLAVDAEGAVLGPDCVLVCRTAEGYRCIARDEAVALQKCLSADPSNADWLFGQCRRIAKALDRQDIPLAQILGLYMPIGELDTERLRHLAIAAPFIKANFNPDEARIPAGQPGGGQWTDGSSGPTGAIIPAQLTIPWDLPAEIPWEIPGAPSEITPLPFDLPGAERERPPLPTNPFPRDPECAEEWAAAQEYCDEMRRQGKFRPGYGGPGKDMRSCLLGQVSERCGGNPTA
jgi:hypothetical protein